jgi:peptidoglycan/LPS O-acetylase OafA/YrhL
MTTRAPRTGGLSSPSGTALQVGRLDQRADIQWLRALAVLLVIGYHLDLPGFAGGYVGVDVFFVLSGYLITRLLLHELYATGRIDLPAFALRRIRRLLPVSTVVLVTTLVWIWLAASPVERVLEKGVARATPWFIANIALASQQTDYLTAGDQSALQHYWSLAVEEQFYLVWPTLLVTLGFVARRRSWPVARTLVVAMVVLGAASMSVAAWWTVRSQPTAFFLLPARAWELLGGGLVAAAELAGRRPRWRAAPRIAGIGIVLAVTLSGTVLRFPWPLALAPVLAATALVWAGVREGTPPPVMRSAWMRWIGDRSYALYLWHWPPLVLLELTSEPWSSRPATRIVVVLGVFAATELTHRFIEQPLRRAAWLRPWPAGVALLAGCVGLSAVVAVAATATPPAPATETITDAGAVSPMADEVPTVVPADLAPTLIGATNDAGPLYSDGCHALTEAEAPLPVADCTFGDAASDTTVLLTGDSHAAMWFPALEKMAVERGWRLVVATKSGCATFVLNRPWQDGPWSSGVYVQCPPWQAAALDQLEALAPDVIVTTAWATTERRAMGDEWPAAIRNGIAEMRVRAPHAQVLLLLDPAPLPENAPQCLAESPVAACGGVPDDAFDAMQRAMAEEAADGYLDVPALLCDADACPAIIGSTLVFRDNNHLSSVMALRLGPELERLIVSLLREP